MSGISTHILDTALGRPADGVEVVLERTASPGVWEELARARTDTDGRCRPLLPAGQVRAGVHRLTFGTEPWFTARQVPTLYPEIAITFHVAHDGASYHLPLLLNPFGYTTYRGS